MWALKISVKADKMLCALIYLQDASDILYLLSHPIIKHIITLETLQKCSPSTKSALPRVSYLKISLNMREQYARKEDVRIMTTLQKLTPSFDPWEAYLDVEQHGQMTLSNIEFTTTNLCNMRCAHCAVGYTLQNKDPEALPMDLITKRLDEIPHLKTLSITWSTYTNQL